MLSGAVGSLHDHDASSVAEYAWPLQVQKEDLTAALDISAIAYATNSWLHETRVSRAIAAAAGPAFQQSRSDILTAKSNYVAPGQVEISSFPLTGGSQFSCHHVVHAVLPHRQGECYRVFLSSYA